MLTVKAQLGRIRVAINVEPITGDADEGFRQDVGTAFISLDHIGNGFVPTS
ncbi:MAG: hypothetical protein ACK4ZY_09340 [Sphingomonas sp.]